MNIKKIIGYLLVAVLVIGMTVGIICIFHFIGDFILVDSILFTLGVYIAVALLIFIISLTIDLITD